MMENEPRLKKNRENNFFVYIYIYINQMANNQKLSKEITDD